MTFIQSSHLDATQADMDALRIVRSSRGRPSFEEASQMMAEVDFDEKLEVEFGFLCTKQIGEEVLTLFASAAGSSAASILQLREF